MSFLFLVYGLNKIMISPFALSTEPKEEQELEISDAVNTTVVEGGSTALQCTVRTSHQPTILVSTCTIVTQLQFPLPRGSAYRVLMETVVLTFFSSAVKLNT